MITDEQLEYTKRLAREVAMIVMEHAKSTDCKHCQQLLVEAFKRVDKLQAL